mmetsp:Transcript_50069/g.79258  ORF Transcript_50069/g.79258 Transcript_50069/m.79258 type:complete len:231 (-) Transcript_50069:386-1078(-)
MWRKDMAIPLCCVGGSSWCMFRLIRGRNSATDRAWRDRNLLARGANRVYTLLGNALRLRRSTGSFRDAPWFGICRCHRLRGPFCEVRVRVFWLVLCWCCFGYVLLYCHPHSYSRDIDALVRRSPHHQRWLYNPRALRRRGISLSRARLGGCRRWTLRKRRDWQLCVSSTTSSSWSSHLPSQTRAKNRSSVCCGRACFQCSRDFDWIWLRTASQLSILACSCDRLALACRR